SKWELAVEITSLPPSGMASRALTDRLSSNWFGIGLDQPELRAEVGFQQNILVDEPLQHALGAADQGVEIERARAADLAPSEGEQLLGEGGRAFAGAADFLNRRSLGIVCRKVVEEHVAVAVDDGQQVVEVVGDAAGEASDGLHFLRLQQLLLQ